MEVESSITSKIVLGVRTIFARLQGEDKPLYLSPRQDSPTMDDVATCA